MEHVVHPSSLLALIPLLPLIGAAINGLFGWKWSAKRSGVVASAAIGGSFVLSVISVAQLAALPAEERVIGQTVYTWLASGPLQVNLAFLLDPLSAVMILVVSGVGSLIHIYSIGYMGHDPAPGRYFTYLNLFAFSMLVLVLGANLPLLFVGWEGVGLCSYLLIGFWYTDAAKAAAGMKAFVVNRIGDFGFVVGMLLIFWGMHKAGTPTMDFMTLADRSDAMMHLYVGLPVVGQVRLVTLACLCLFVGATGKSAQLPLYVWLPDAMAGPTPVSALIHAATMVTAGVYMIARLNFLYLMSPTAMTVVATVGALTAVFAATIGLVQNDIKKVLAYSTVSQLGYMFIGVGVGAYGAAVFHLMTHAFFKACLFLGSGSVIHAMHEEQDIRAMGGLKKWMPRTYWTFLIASIALAGVPPLAGFFSKDEILHIAHHWHGAQIGDFALHNWGYVIYGLGLVGAFCTAFYMTRLVALTFWGECRADAHTQEHLHESPNSMTIPLIVLAFLSVVGGFLGLPYGLSVLEHWFEPVLATPAAAHASPTAGLITGTIVACGSIAFGLYLYHWRKDLPGKIAGKARALHKLLLGKYFVDEIYQTFIIRPLVAGSRFLWRVADATIVDGLVNLTGAMTKAASTGVSRIQTGNAQTYAIWLLFGLGILLGASQVTRFLAMILN